MRRISRIVVVLGLGIGWAARPVLGENLGQAWDTASRVNAQLQAQQAESMAAGLNVKAAKSDRFPSVRNFTFNAFLSVSPQISPSSFFGSSSGGSKGGAAAGGLSGLPSAISLLGSRTARPSGLAYLCKRSPLYGGTASAEHRRRRGPARRPEERGVPHGSGPEADRGRSLRRSPPAPEESGSRPEQRRATHLVRQGRAEPPRAGPGHP